jgi:hypothetical protein
MKQPKQTLKLLNESTRTTDDKAGRKGIPKGKPSPLPPFHFIHWDIQLDIENPLYRKILHRGDFVK